jgi:hypothetical protein
LEYLNGRDNLGDIGVSGAKIKMDLKETGCADMDCINLDPGV